MGIDLQGVIEFQDMASFDQPFGFAYLHWSRNSDLFSLLNVNSSSCMLPKRGLPRPTSIMTLTHYAAEAVAEEKRNYGRWVTVGEAEAMELVEDCGADFVDSPCLDGTWVSDPANQWPNWASLKELRTVAQSANDSGFIVSPECEITVAAMASLEESGYSTRLVYWFDV